MSDLEMIAFVCPIIVLSITFCRMIIYSVVERERNAGKVVDLMTIGIVTCMAIIFEIGYFTLKYGSLAPLF